MGRTVIDVEQFASKLKACEEDGCAELSIDAVLDLLNKEEKIVLFRNQGLRGESWKRSGTYHDTCPYCSERSDNIGADWKGCPYCLGRIYRKDETEEEMEE